MAYEVIHLKPTLDTSAYADNDILFTAEAIQLPSRSCKVLSIQAIWSDAQAVDEELIVLFHRENVQILGGAANAASAITSALVRPDSGSLLGALRLSQDASIEAGIGSNISLLVTGGNVGAAANVMLGPNPPLVVSSGKEAHKIYVSAFLEQSGGVTCPADSLDIFIHVEY